MVRWGNWAKFLVLKNKIKNWTKLTDFSIKKRILILIFSLLFLFFYSTSHIKHDIVLVEENKKLLNYISILEKATMTQTQEIYYLKKRCKLVY